MIETLLSRLAHERAPTRAVLYRAWRALTLRTLRPGAGASAFDRFYELPDPWDQGSSREQQRFLSTNAVIRALAGPVGTLLEIGCGEGHQSAHLVQVCRQLHGLDLSARAVQRAQVRVPSGRFEAGTLSELPWRLPDDGRYDLVVACEVLYYMPDIGAAIEAMSRLGRACLVTFFGPATRRVAPHLDLIQDMQRGWFHHEGVAWMWAFWTVPTSSPATGSGMPVPEP